MSTDVSMLRMIGGCGGWIVISKRATQVSVTALSCIRNVALLIAWYEGVSSAMGIVYFELATLATTRYYCT